MPAVQRCAPVGTHSNDSVPDLIELPFGPPWRRLRLTVLCCVWPRWEWRLTPESPTGSEASPASTYFKWAFVTSRVGSGLRLPPRLLLLTFGHVCVVDGAVAEFAHLGEDVLRIRLKPLFFAGLPGFLVEGFLLPLSVRGFPVVEHLRDGAAAVVVVLLTQRTRTARCSQCESRALRKARTGDHHSPVASADHSPHTRIGFSSLSGRLRVLASRSMRSAGEDETDDDRNCDRRTRRRCVGA